MLSETHLLESIGGLSRHELKAWVERGWVAPTRHGGVVTYHEIDVARVELIRDMRDLVADDETMALVLALIDQIYGLRCQLRQVLDAVRDQPDDVQQAIAAHVRRAQED